MKNMSLTYIVRECNLSTSEKTFISDFNIINKNKIANQRLEAFAVYQLLKMYMGADKESGFFLKADEKHLKLLASDLLYGIDLKFINRVLYSCFENNLFDKTLYDKFNILTSLDIQEKYFYSENVKRRALKTISNYKDFVYVSIWKDLKLADKNKKVASKKGEVASNNKETRRDETKNKTQTQIESETAFRSEALKNFLSQFPNKQFDENTVVPEDINLDILAKKIKESDFLMETKDLTWCINHYDKILTNCYITYNKQKQPNQNYSNRDYSGQDLNQLYDDLENVEL